MARADRRRTRRTASPAVVHRGGGTTVTEDALFFSRLRKQAKWIFVLLAVIFGGSFVVFGVGSEVPGGIADVLGRTPGGPAGIPSVSEAREQVEERPNDPEALRALSTALQAEGETDEAIEVLERARAIRQDDEATLRELATLYVSQAMRLRTEAQRLQMEVQRLAPESEFLPPADTDLGRALRDRPVTEAVTTQANERFMELLNGLQTAYASARDVYQALAEVRPEDPTVQLQLADAAVNSGDTETAIAAYRRFIELAPDDPSAPLVQQEIERLEGGPAAEEGDEGAGGEDATDDGPDGDSG